MHKEENDMLEEEIREICHRAKEKGWYTTVDSTLDSSVETTSILRDRWW